MEFCHACVKNVAETEDRKRYKFEATATFLLPNCPVTRRRDTKKQVSGEISEVNVEEIPQVEVAAFGNKPSIGKTGVHLRYHNYKFQQLTYEQKDELNTYCKKHGNFKKSRNGKSQAGSRSNKKKDEVKKKVKFEHAVNAAVAK